ncbi:MAG: ribosome small subunit-dependent GTPase A [Bacteroidales bacterium]|nr:ribosome small subunit-dependent GTPase A [Bacteroidales bacterium]MDD4057759.1 ribosome small subunit-dependent GTPase A [Bacteroidales bacterium]
MEKRGIKSAIVVKHTGSHYMVSPLPLWDPVECVVRGRLRLKGSKTTNPLAVGDIVKYEPGDDGKGIIVSIEPRKNYIIRKSTNLSRESHIIASNIGTAYLVTTLIHPEVKTVFLDRFLVTCEAYRVPVKILLNKRDLLDREEIDMLENFKQIYEGAGYEIIEVSAKTGLNIEKLRDECKGKVSLFSGQSGVGKSSLINAMDSNLILKTANISDYHLQGKHTTTFYEMHPLNSGGFIIDTPGIRGFGLVEMEREELSHYFPEMLKLNQECRFAPCTHTHEPGCRVKEAVDNNEISADRYLSYLGMLDEEEKYR